MKIGVSTVPWGKTSRPVRAELRGSVARTEKDTAKGSGIGRKSTLAKPKRHRAHCWKIRFSTETFPIRRRFFPRPENYFRINFRWRNSDARVVSATVEPNTNHSNHTNTMKLFLSALCATIIASPLAFADGCGKCKGDNKEKKEDTVLAACGKCDCGKSKDEKCTDCKCSKETEILAGKCKKDGDCDKEKEEEGTLLADKCKKDGDCDKEKEEGTLLAGKCKKDGGCDDEEDDCVIA